MKTRKSIRLPNYDYSQAGDYFITICVNNRMNRLGNISNGANILSMEGQIVDKWIVHLTEKFETIFIADYIIMPNHIHLIIEINHQIKNQTLEIDKEEDFDKWRIARSKMLLPKIINYLKTNSSTEINRINNESGNKFWQANYYEHIVRNEKEFLKISSYIENNPITWEEDRFNHL